MPKGGILLILSVFFLHMSLGGQSYHRNTDNKGLDFTKNLSNYVGVSYVFVLGF